jgi:molybdenum cofactor cytidylyltransferase
MGRAKAALPLRDATDTFLSRLIGSARTAGLPEIVVVSGADPVAVRQAAGRSDRRVRVIENPAWASGQLSSLLAGLAVPARAPIEAAVVLLVDVPLVSPATIRRLVEVWRDTHAPIVRPARGDEHGHPVIFDAALFAELRAADPTVGAKAVVRAHAAEIVNVPIDDAGAFTDIDTPEAYDAILGAMR